MEIDLGYTQLELSLLALGKDKNVYKEKGKINISTGFLLPGSLPVFSGHFPEQPVFPAVIQLSLVRLICSQTIQKRLANISVGKTKFSYVIRPEDEIRLKIVLSENQTGHEAKFQYYNHGKLASTGTVSYKEVEK